MKASVYYEYGSPDVIKLEEIDQPQIKDDEVLVRVRAAALHRGDCFLLRGSPFIARLFTGLTRPKNRVLGLDVAGQVEAVGKNVTKLAPGDDVFGEIFGSGNGACAEFTCAAQDRFAAKPANISFEQAAAITTSGVTALRGIRDVGKVQAGQKVLVNGSSGGVGTFAVQIANSLGAEVTGVCSTRNVEMVKSIGADHVIDYTKEDFTQGGQNYDLILDNVGNHSPANCRRALKSEGILLPNSGTAGMGYILNAAFSSIFVRKQGSPFLAEPKQEDLVYLKELIESGKVTPVIDRSYPLSETPEAFRHLEQGHARGKVVITLGDQDRENEPPA
jgi:NADPH:quinone reductase-like Zn-dependent oxidoreductase